jgi:hypothetical protein
VLHLSSSSAIRKQGFRTIARRSVERKPRLIIGVLLAFLLFLPVRALAQAPDADNSVQEIVANLDAGCAVVGVAKDGIVIATLENPIEPATRPPAIVQLSEERVAVLLGATDWWLPDEHRELSQIEIDLRSLPVTEGPASPTLQAEAGGEATDIEQIANRLHGHLNSIVGRIHGNLNLGEKEPLVEMLLVDYAPDYGPEVWLIRYLVEQEPEQGDFWQTRALPPHYSQLWPPEKGQPRGLVETCYPEAPDRASLEQLLRGGDPRVERVIHTSPELQGASEEILNGETEKLTAVEMAALLRSTLSAIAAPNARMIEAEINKEQGVGWFIPPPPFPKLPGSESARPPGAPSLMRPPGKPDGPGQS